MEHFQTPRASFESTATIGANYTSNIRLLGQKDEVELCRIFLTLEPSARYCRFGASMTDACLIDHAKHSLANADWIVGAFVGGHLRGLVEVYSGQSSDDVEAAFVVEREWRRRGLGWALLQAAIQKAKACEADAIKMIFSRHNWPMRKLANKASAKLDIVLDEMCVDIPLSGPGIMNFA